MHKLSICLLLIFCSFVPSFAQDSVKDSILRHFDSLERALYAAPKQEQSTMLENIMREVRKSPVEVEHLHLKFGKAMIKIGKETGNDTLVVRGMNILAISPREVGGQDSALSYRLQTLKIAKKTWF